LCQKIKEMTQVPVTVYVEMTPNPNTMKFVANKYILLTGESVEFTSQAEAKGYSPLAEELFNFPFITGVFIASNFVTIAKNDSISWDFVAMELREFVKNWLADSKDVLIQMPAPKAKVSTDASKPVKEYAPSEYDDAIRSLLDEYVRPAVEGAESKFTSPESPEPTPAVDDPPEPDMIETIPPFKLVEGPPNN
jgi:hypothetical protein